MTVMAVDDAPVAPARLRLDAHPTALAALGHGLERIPVARDLAAVAYAAMRPTVTGLTGGLQIVPDPALPPSSWRLHADGRLVLSGTVTAP